MAGQVRSALRIAQAGSKGQSEPGGQDAQAGGSKCRRKGTVDQRCGHFECATRPGKLQHRQAAEGNRKYRIYFYEILTLIRTQLRGMQRTILCYILSREFIVVISHWSYLSEETANLLALKSFLMIALNYREILN